MVKLDKALAGVAGEYFVAAELSRRGYIASLTLKNTRGMDILVTNAAAKKSVTIQVKTSQGKRQWILSEKCERFAADNHFYVFVTLGDEALRPDFHVVPSGEVAKEITVSHQEWLKAPGRKGQQRNDTSMRVYGDSAGKFIDRWDLLGL